MRIAGAALAMLLILPACEHFEQDKRAAVVQTEMDSKQVQDNVARQFQRVADTTRDNVKKTNNKVRDWWITPPPKKYATPIESSYCYRAQTDILCYRSPMPGWEGRLVAYQGTVADAPPIAIMEPLPKRATVQPKDRSPENKVASMIPVFKEAPPAIEAPPVPADADPTTIDPTREQLPNPATSPQL